jgi:hypothetical protein
MSIFIFDYLTPTTGKPGIGFLIAVFLILTELDAPKRTEQPDQASRKIQIRRRFTGLPLIQAIGLS